MKVKTRTGYAYIFYDKNTPRGKKYSVITPKGKLIHFGAAGYEQYKDRIGKYKSLDHKDPVRRKAYRLRHSSDYITDPEYPGYYSWKYLW